MNHTLVVLAILGLLVGAVFLLSERGPGQVNEQVDLRTDDAAEDTVVEERVETPPQSSGGGGKTLDLSGQGLTKVPDSVFKRTDIEALNLSDNNLSGALQAEVRHLVNLRSLDLSNNNFTGVPAEVGQLSKLETLNLSDNPITGLPHEIGNLKNLKVLDLRGTNYAEQDLAIIRQGLQPGVDIKVD